MIQPTNNQLAYPQQGGANAVSINIYNPQAYGSTPNQAQAAPYAYPNSLYQMPQASMYNQFSPVANPQAGYYQQYIPMQTPFQPQYNPFLDQQAAYQQQFIPAQMPAMPQQYNPALDQQAAYPQQYAPAQMPMEPAAPIVLPAPQTMPGSVLDETQEAAPVQVVEEQQPAAEVQKVDTDALVQALNGTDADKRAEAINKIAIHAQDEPQVALQVVSEPIMNALVDVIKEDTSSLEGPTDKQIEIAEKITKGETLTPEEDALSEQLSPRDKANKNRIFALYTLAMVQKLQRDELNQYIETQKANGEEPIAPLNVQDLAGYSDIVNVIQNDSRPEVKIAAIQALGYVAEAQDKAAIDEVLKDSLNSTDEAVKKAASEVAEKFSEVQTA